MFLALSGLVTLGVSCSSDDNSSDEVKEGQLAVTADKTEIKEGDSVKFTITLDGKADTSAELFIEDTQIYTPHKFDKAGKYNVVAKKKGAKTSAPVTITVSEKDGGTDPVEKTLTLKADNISVKVGGTVTFTVTDGTAAVADPIIRIVGGEAIKGATWTATKAGEFKFVASKEGFKDSKEVLVKVEEPTVVPTENFVMVGNNAIDLKGAALFYFTSGGVVYSMEFEGKTYIPFRINTFTVEIDGTVKAEYYENGAYLVFYVEQNADSKDIVFPWEVGADKILLDSYGGKINGVAFEADKDTKFSVPVLTAIDGKGFGNAKFVVQGNDELSKEALLADYNNKFQGFYEIKLSANGDSKSIKSLGAEAFDNKVNDLSTLKRK